MQDEQTIHSVGKPKFLNHLHNWLPELALGSGVVRSIDLIDSHGEGVKAFVIFKEGAEATEAELSAWVKQNMTDYRYFRLIAFHTTLPMSATAKILKQELR